MQKGEGNHERYIWLSPLRRWPLSSGQRFRCRALGPSCRSNGAHTWSSSPGCNDCHTPGFFFGKPDKDKFLGGSDVGFEIPGLGVFNGRNITPDKETGLGSWTDEQIATAITTGKRPDGRQLAPIMNYAAFTHMTKDDVAAVVAYLRSIPPVHNKVPGPFKPGEKVSIFTFRIEPPGQMAAEAPK